MAPSRPIILLVVAVSVLLFAAFSFSSQRDSAIEFGYQVVAGHGSLGASSPSAALAPTSCPNPRLPSPGPVPLPEPGRTCTRLPSLHEDLTFDACRHADHCAALDLVIKRTNAAHCTRVQDAMRTTPVSNDSSLTSWVRESLGPDGFMVLVDGSERFARFEPDLFKSTCEYTYSLRFNNSGPMSIQVFWHFEDYFLYNENNMEWPVMATERTLLAEPLYLNVCPSCPTHVAPPNSVNASLLDPVVSPTTACSVTDPVYGAFIPVSYLDAHWPGRFYEPLPPNQDAYSFVSAPACAWKHAGTRYADHEPCFRAPQHSVLFMGDSHMRVAFDGVVHRLEGAQWTMTESEKSGHKNASFPNRYIDFRWDPAGEGLLFLDCKEIAEFDTIGFSIGHHLHGLSTKEYLAHVNLIMDHLTSLVATCPSPRGLRRLLYITPPGVAPREDEFVRTLKDRRTNARISHWARLGRAAAAQRGNAWRTVDQFTLTSAFVRDTKDAAHFIETDALDAVLDDIIGKLGICDFQ